MPSTLCSSTAEEPVVTINSPAKEIISPKPQRQAGMDSIIRLATIIEENAVNPPAAIKTETRAKSKDESKFYTKTTTETDEPFAYKSIRELMVGSEPDYSNNSDNGARFGVIGGERARKKVGVIGEERRRNGGLR